MGIEHDKQVGIDYDKHVEQERQYLIANGWTQFGGGDNWYHPGVSGGIHFARHSAVGLTKYPPKEESTISRPNPIEEMSQSLADEVLPPGESNKALAQEIHLLIDERIYIHNHLNEVHKG